MAADDTRRDLRAGVPVVAFADTGMVAGVIDDVDVLLVRTVHGIYAVGAKCTHKGASLAKGLVVGDTVRCPWHHACFDVRTGAALAAPAFRPLDRWVVEERDGQVFARKALASPEAAGRSQADGRIVIVGAGAAGAAAADALARLGCGERVTLIGNETEPPYDRTMLTKHFLAGTAGEEELPLAIDDLAQRGVDVRLAATVVAIEPEATCVRLADGTALPYAKLILATGAEPKRLTVPGAELPHVRVLRSAADARALIAAAVDARHVVIAGGSFIALEAAAALRDRKLDVTVVSPDRHPLARTMGAAVADAIMAVHRERGTAFRLGARIARIEPARVTLDDGTVLPADLVLAGVGVEPRTALAEAAGLEVDDGVVVDERLRSSDRDIYAVGDIARWPDPHSGASIRAEHWTVAQRQGQVAAANAVGHSLRYDVVPFFWTMHFDYSVRLVGHARPDDTVTVDGDPARKKAVLHFTRDGRETAVATVEQDMACLDAELIMERRLGQPAAMLPAR